VEVDIGGPAAEARRQNVNSVTRRTRTCRRDRRTSLVTPFGELASSRRPPGRSSNPCRVSVDPCPLRVLLWGSLSSRTFSTRWLMVRFRLPASVVGWGWGSVEDQGFVLGDSAAHMFSVRRREPSFYLGLVGPLLPSALPGGIASDGGLELECSDQTRSGCTPLPFSRPFP
jgi:hypothetical protein